MRHFGFRFASIAIIAGALFCSVPSVHAQSKGNRGTRGTKGTQGTKKDDNSKADNKSVDRETMRFVPGKGVEFTSVDGRFRLQTRVRGQFLYQFDDEGVGDREQSQRFQLRRARAQFTGHAYGKHNKFKFELAFAPRDLGFTLDKGAGDDARSLRNPPVVSDRDKRPSRSPLLDFYADFTYLRDLTLRVGQYKVPLSRQRVVSSGNLQFVDRSIVNAEFTVDRDLGLDFRSKDFLGLGFLKYYAGIYIGEGHSSYQKQDVDFMVLGRVEVLPFGHFKDYSEAALERPDTPKLSIGAGIAFIDEAKGNRGILGSRPSDGGTTDVLVYNADFLLKWTGFSAQGVFFWRDGDRNFGDIAGAAPALPRDGWGFSTQAGYLLPSTNFEVAARFAMIEPNDDSSLTEEKETGVALSYYFAGHPYKVQADYLRIWEDDFEVGASQFRVQMQLSF